MSVEELDRIAAALPEWERMPPPASGVEADRLALVARVEAESAAVYRQHESRMESLRSMERTVWVLAVALLAGTVAAVVAEVFSGPPATPEFFREKS